MKETIDLLLYDTYIYKFAPTLPGVVTTPLPHTFSYSGTNVFRYSTYSTNAYSGPSLDGKVIRSFNVIGSVTRNVVSTFRPAFEFLYDGNTPIDTGGNEFPDIFPPFASSASGVTPFDLSAPPDVTAPLCRPRTDGMVGFAIRWENGNNGPFNFTVPNGFCTGLTIDIDDPPTWTLIDPPEVLALGIDTVVVVEATYPDGEPVVGARFEVSSNNSAAEIVDGVSWIYTGPDGRASFLVRGVTPTEDAIEITIENQANSYSWDGYYQQWIDAQVVAAGPDCFWTDVVGVAQDCAS